MRITLNRILLTIILITVIARDSWACGMCAFAAVDSFLPPIYYWCGLSIAYLLALIIIGWMFQLKIPLLFSGGSGIIVIIIGFVGAMFMLGAFSLLPLAVPAFITSLVALFKIGLFKQNPIPHRYVNYLSIVIIILIGVGIGWRKRILETRTDAKVYLQWSGTMTGRALQMKFRQQEPASINEYRYIVDHGSEYEMSDAARRIGIIGDPAIDIPRLRNAMNRVEGGYKQAIKEAIDSISLREKRKGGPDHDTAK